MPTIWYIIKRFFARYQPIQKQLEKVQYQIEVERLMQYLVSIPADQLKAKLATSTVTIDGYSQTAESWLKNVNALLEAEKARRQIELATFQEIRKLNDAIANELRKV